MISSLQNWVMGWSAASAKPTWPVAYLHISIRESVGWQQVEPLVVYTMIGEVPFYVYICFVVFCVFCKDQIGHLCMVLSSWDNTHPPYGLKFRVYGLDNIFGLQFFTCKTSERVLDNNHCLLGWWSPCYDAEGINDQKHHAEELANLLHHWELGRHVNIIPYNPVADSEFRRPRKQAVSKGR